LKIYKKHLYYICIIAGFKATTLLYSDRYTLHRNGINFTHNLYEKKKVAEK